MTDGLWGSAIILDGILPWVTSLPYTTDLKILISSFGPEIHSVS